MVYGFFYILFRSSNAGTSDGTASVVSITKVSHTNNNITPINPESEACETCNRYPHPVGSVNKLDAKLQLSFPLRSTGTSCTTTTRKSTRIVTHGRVITSEEILQQIKVTSTHDIYAGKPPSYSISVDV